MSGMDALRAAMESRKSDALKRKAQSGRTWVKRTELEVDQKQAAINEHEARVAVEKAQEEERLRQMQEFLQTKEMKEAEKQVAETAKVQENAAPHWEAVGEDDIPPLELWDVMSRLRAFGQPITLFNETQAKRYKRLRTVEAEDAEQSLTTFNRPAGSKGSKKDADREIDDEFKNKETSVVTNPKEASVIRWMKDVIEVWTQELDAKPEDEAKRDKELNQKMKADLKPVMSKLKHNQLDVKLVGKLSQIVEQARERDYDGAERTYVQVTIGNAPWPLGTANPCPHQRANDTLHATPNQMMTQDGVIQTCRAIKRLLTYSQSKWPSK